MKNKTIWFSFILSIAAYVLLAYTIPREQYIKLFSLFFLLFGISLYLIYKSDKFKNIKILLAYALIFRLIFLLAIPALSDDYLRFVWDGQLVAHGINPFNSLPVDLIHQTSVLKIPLSQELFNQMKPLQLNNYTCYPPFNQLFFAIGAFFFEKSILGNIIVMRLFILVAEAGTIYMGIKILKLLNLPEKNILWYALNPLIIIELTGNLHFEGIMIFFISLTLYFMVKGKVILTSSALAFAASVKLIPLIFLPQIYKLFSFRKRMLFYLLFLIVFLLLVTPMLTYSFTNTFFKSLKLYFNNFEGNASIYYFFRKVGYWFTDDNMIEIIGKLMAVLIFISVLLISILRRNKSPQMVIQSMLFAYSSYYFLATAVHPWYITPLLILSIFTNYRYAFVWSLFIILSYYTYHDPSFEESKILVLVEYLAVYSVLLFEIIFNKKRFATKI